MRIKELLALSMALVITCIAIVILAAILKIVGLADDVSLPSPEYTSPDEIILSRGVAPQHTDSGLVTYETFEEALERVKSAIPDELTEWAGRAIWGEAGGIPDEAQRAAVVWCACNRADAWDMEIGEVLTVDQFHGLAIKGTVPPPSTSNLRGMCWQGGRWRLRDGRMLDGCCRASTSTLRAMGASIIFPPSTVEENIGKDKWR